MKKILLLLCIPLALSFTQCNRGDKTKTKQQMGSITQTAIDSTVNNLIAKYGDQQKERITRGVSQAAALWTKTDGTENEFKEFCLQHFAGDTTALNALFGRLQTNFEVLFGNFNRISLDLKKPLHIDGGEMIPVDDMFGAYDPFAHLNDDFFANKIAFITVLNFPFYTLKEKIELGPKWSRTQWAYARLGDMYTSRVPAEAQQQFSDALTKADMYISEYNIYMENLIDDKGNTYFPKDMKLISHWGLRDELKANYQGENGLAKQKMIYQVMLRIIMQEIPDSAINNPSVQWNPYTNKVFKDKKELTAKPEDNNRYGHMLSLFNAIQKIDEYNPQYPTYIQRAFEQGMEMPQQEVEKLFIDFVSSPEVKQVAQRISKRLNRKLEPFDIWYDGFKPRSSISEDELTAKVRAKYKNVADFQNDLSNILVKLGFAKDKAEYIASKISIDPARGSGHAWGTMMKGDVSHLRARFPKEGWNYKGYNIATHEFGHNVEQTLSMYDVDYYSLAGVPNTGFTEALAFIFQKRDLDLLGIKNDNPNKEYLQTLDDFWGCYEIMGVSLVDMQTWKWLYEHPKATKAELKEAVIANAKDVWNKYYADVLGIKDCPLLAIYSHMIDNPLYLSNYPVGHLVQFQVEEYMKGKNLADETIRMFTYGRTIPEVWMKNAVGAPISIQPMLKATKEALAKTEMP
ncbi:MAG TPA: hypothetical protein PLI16_02580 [Bacteroidales bacterium]|nr:hypothetical protein [Bacteroidales bacterium]